jgi:hypothetical protein
LFAALSETRDAFPVVVFFSGAELRAALISEPYALVGGPAPYHDTYCQTLFAPSDVVAGFVEEVRKRFGERLTDCFEGATAPPMGPRQTLRWLWRQVGATRHQRRHERLVARMLSMSDP